MKTAVSIWRGPLLKGALVLAGLSILAFAGHGAVALALPANAAEASLATIAPATPPPAAPAPAAIPTYQLPETTITGQAPVEAVTAKMATSGDAGTTERIALNAATEADLEKLPGIGAKKAALVLALRQKLGRFHAVEDLLKVKGMGRKRLAKIRPFVTVDST